MREIKFRAWDQILKKMVYEDHTSDGVGSIYLPNWKILQLYDVVMIWTGLKDKNEKEIYEGDICRHRVVNDNGEFEENWGITEIWFHEGQFLTRHFAFPVHSFTKTGKSEIEIIGNIYENGELLNDQRRQDQTRNSSPAQDR